MNKDAWKTATETLNAKIDGLVVANDLRPYAQGQLHATLHAVEMAGYSDEFGPDMTEEYLRDGLDIVRQYRGNMAPVPANANKVPFPLLGDDALDYLRGAHETYGEALTTFETVAA